MSGAGDQRGCAALGVAYPCYGADDLTERAQVATFIARLLGVDDEDHGNGGFTDLAGLPLDMQRAVGTLAHYGIMIGYGDGRFGPFNKITHTETILVISRAVVLEGDWTPRDPGRSRHLPQPEPHPGSAARPGDLRAERG
ncbi:MAG: S-layer homology domain-containing protein [Thermomicrobiales bacterium]